MEHKTEYLATRLAALCALILGLMSPSIFAQTTTYRYEGSLFNMCGATDPVTGILTAIPCPANGRITGTFTLSQPIPKNSSSTDIDSAPNFAPDSFAFTDGQTTISQDNGFASIFTVIIDRQGSSWCQWNMHVSEKSPPGTEIRVRHDSGRLTRSGIQYLLSGYFNVDGSGGSGGTWYKLGPGGTRTIVSAESGCLKVVANINGGKDEAGAVGSSPVNAHFPLGATIQIGLQDLTGNPIPSTFSLGTPTIEVDPDLADIEMLFPNHAIFQYRSNTAAARGFFQAVHQGTVDLTITPSSSALRPVIVHLVVVQPNNLGNTDSVDTDGTPIDALVYPLANQSGIPPQYIKAQMFQEGRTSSKAPINPLAYRYEPVSASGVGDLSVSRGADLRAKSPYSSYNFKTMADKKDTPGLSEGALIRFEDFTTRTNFSSCGSEPTASCIVTHYDFAPIVGPRPRWCSQSTKALEKCFDLARGNDNWTAQTSLAASYGYLQVMYTTAASTLHWNGVNGKLNPTFLFDTPENRLNGGGSLNLGVQYVALSFDRIYKSISDNPSTLQAETALRGLFIPPWETYNGPGSKKSGYARKIYNRVPQYLPQLGPGETIF